MSTLREVLEKIAKNELSVEEAERLLRFNAIEEIGRCAKIDVSREFRNGVPEIILAEGKATRDLLEIVTNLLSKSDRIIISRCSSKQIKDIGAAVPDNLVLQIHEKARMVIIRKPTAVASSSGGKIG